MVSLHHVNLGVPVGGEDAEGTFLVEGLGFRRVEAGPEITAMGGRPMWFEGEGGDQIHLSVDPDHRPAAKAHVAVDLGAKLTEAEGWLQASGRRFEVAEADGVRIVVTKDPAGNRWELRGPIP